MFLALALFIAQESGFRFPYDQQCGSPLAQSQWFKSVSGRLTAIEKDRLRVRLDSDERELLVQIAGVRIRGRQDFRNLLKQRIGERVEVIVPQSEPLSSTLQAKVSLGGQDLGLRLIVDRIARFVEPQPYHLTSYEACSYRKPTERKHHD